MTRYALLTQVSEANRLPDGTVITWLPIIDDPTSEAVAFVRKISHELDGDYHAAPQPAIWLSPGNGWEPESFDVLRFPVKVIALGTVKPGDFVPDIVDESDIASDRLTIGPSDRVTALNTAARVWSGQEYASDELVLRTAESFLAWLGRDPLAETLRTLIDQGVVAAVNAPFNSTFDSRRDGAQS